MFNIHPNHSGVSFFRMKQLKTPKKKTSFEWVKHRKLSFTLRRKNICTVQWAKCLQRVNLWLKGVRVLAECASSLLM